MYFWYKFLTYLFYPFAPIYLYSRVLRKKEDSSRYKEKLSKINIVRKDGFLIWLHVSSVGEAMGILPLIDNFLKEEKVEKILITSITLSSANVLKKKIYSKPENNSPIFTLGYNNINQKIFRTLEAKFSNFCRVWNLAKFDF